MEFSNIDGFAAMYGRYDILREVPARFRGNIIDYCTYMFQATLAYSMIEMYAGKIAQVQYSNQLEPLFDELYRAFSWAKRIDDILLEGLIQ